MKSVLLGHLQQYRLKLLHCAEQLRHCALLNLLSASLHRAQFRITFTWSFLVIQFSTVGGVRSVGIQSSKQRAFISKLKCFNHRVLCDYCLIIKSKEFCLNCALNGKLNKIIFYHILNLFYTESTGYFRPEIRSREFKVKYPRRSA